MSVKPVQTSAMWQHRAQTQVAQLGAAELGLAAATGHSHVSVYRKVSAAVFSTGDELVSLQEKLPTHGQIYDSNRYTLTGLLRSSRCSVFLTLGIVPDTPDEVRNVFRLAA